MRNIVFIVVTLAAAFGIVAVAQEQVEVQVASSHAVALEPRGNTVSRSSTRPIIEESGEIQRLKARADAEKRLAMMEARREKMRRQRLAERREERRQERLAEQPQPVVVPTPVEKPKPQPTPQPTGLSMAECPSGSSVESGLVQNAIEVHRAVCANFPSITVYGGLRPGDTGSYHSTGQAVDIMVSGELGWSVAQFLMDNREALGVHQLIYSQKIWTVERSGEGWRWMEDRGSTTANHYDHVHVSVY